MPKSTLISPHGGELIDRMPVADDLKALQERAQAAPKVSLSEVSLSDLELIATGVFSPLKGFMTSAEYKSVVHKMHLPNGLPWTIPVALPVTKEVADKLNPGQDVALYDENDRLVGLLELTEKYPYAKDVEVENVYRTQDSAHPGVARVYNQGEIYLAGPIWLLAEPQPEFPDLYNTPKKTRAMFEERGWRLIVAFQTRNPIHRAHEYLLKCALEMADGLFLNPLVGATKSDDIPAHVRVKSYKVLLESYFPNDRVILSSYPAAMRYAGPREAIFHAIARKNYGCSHFIVGRDHAGVGNYYGTYDAQKMFDEFDPGLIGITPVKFEHSFYCNSCGQIVTAKTCPHGKDSWMSLSGTQVRQKLLAGEMLPVEFTRPEVSQVLIRGMEGNA